MEIKINYLVKIGTVLLWRIQYWGINQREREFITKSMINKENFEFTFCEGLDSFGEVIDIEPGSRVFFVGVVGTLGPGFLSTVMEITSSIRKQHLTDNDIILE